MSGITETQRRLLVHIRRCMDGDGIPPTIRELCALMRYRSTNAMQDALAALERKGMIVNVPGFRGIKLTPAGRVVSFGGDVREPWQVHPDDYAELIVTERQLDTMAEKPIYVSLKELARVGRERWWSIREPILRAEVRAAHCGIVVEAVLGGEDVPAHVIEAHPGVKKIGGGHVRA